jgi:hypothetical protein
MEPDPRSISNFSPMDAARFKRSLRGHAVIGSRRPETIWAVTAVGGIDAYFLTLTHARIAALPAEQIEHPPVYEKTKRAVQPSLM